MRKPSNRLKMAGLQALQKPLRMSQDQENVGRQRESQPNLELPTTSRLSKGHENHGSVNYLQEVPLVEQHGFSSNRQQPKTSITRISRKQKEVNDFCDVVKNDISNAAKFILQ